MDSAWPWAFVRDEDVRSMSPQLSAGHFCCSHSARASTGVRYSRIFESHLAI